MRGSLFESTHRIEMCKMLRVDSFRLITWSVPHCKMRLCGLEYSGFEHKVPRCLNGGLSLEDYWDMDRIGESVFARLDP